MNKKTSNRNKSTVRARVEHIFGAQAAMGGHLVKTIGIDRAKVKIGLLNLAYNLKRLLQLTAIEVQDPVAGLDDHRSDPIDILLEFLQLRTQWLALMTTDLTLSVAQIVEVL